MNVDKIKILSEFVEQAGEQTMTVDNSITVTVKRPERWTWDSDIIEDLFPSDGEATSPRQEAYDRGQA